jgi:hypothetical protein
LVMAALAVAAYARHNTRDRKLARQRALAKSRR